MKVFVITLCVLSSVSAVAQIEQGTWMLGGSAGISSSKNNISFPGSDVEIKTRTGTLSPNVGYFLADRFASGVIVSFTKTRSENSVNEIDSRTSTFGFGPSFRYYFPLSEKVALFPRVSYIFQKTVQHGAIFDPVSGGVIEETDKTKSGTLNAGGGLTYFLNKNIGVEGILNYQAYSSEGSDYTGSLSFNIGFQIYVGK